MRVLVDVAKCSGIGLCEMTAPTVFEVGADGLAQAIESEPTGAELDSAREAVANCPTAALSVEE